MKVEQREIDAVEARLDSQNGVSAACAVAVWSVPVIVLWYWVFQVNDTVAPLMLAISGAIIGLAVRFHGKGYTRTFGLIAFLAHAVMVVAALMLGLTLGEGQTMRAVLYFGFYVAGAWSAVYLSRIGVPFEYHRAFYVLTEQAKHSSSKRLRNRWFCVAPVTLLLCCFTLYISMAVIIGVDTYATVKTDHQKQQQQREAIEDREIDVTSSNLKILSNYEAMRHAYAFFKGQLPSKNGRYFRDYPKSEYKSKRILTYLSEEMGYTRAKFVLGLLTYNKHGIELIKEAADDGDVLAKIHVATEFACYGNVQRATKLLNLLSRTVDDKYAQNEIYSILNAGFERVCADYQTPDFSLAYIHE